LGRPPVNTRLINSDVILIRSQMVAQASRLCRCRLKPPATINSSLNATRYKAAADARKSSELFLNMVSNFMISNAFLLIVPRLYLGTRLYIPLPAGQRPVPLILTGRHIGPPLPPLPCPRQPLLQAHRHLLIKPRQGGDLRHLGHLDGLQVGEVFQ